MRDLQIVGTQRRSHVARQAVRQKDGINVGIKVAYGMIQGSIVEQGGIDGCVRLSILGRVGRVWRGNAQQPISSRKWNCDNV